MNPVTVLIPTANRPRLLASALRSVAGQTARRTIESVVVSENGGNQASEAVARQFEDVLPVRYTFQPPGVSAVGHLARLFSNVTTEDTALLCDDDWWISGHLENSLCALRNSAGASAAFSAVYFQESENSLIAEIYKPAPLAVAGGAGDHLSWWNLSMSQVLAAAWLCTPFHFSSMVARTVALREAAKCLEIAHPNSADRLLEASLCLQGPVLYYPQSTVGVRLHAGNYRSDKSARHMLETFLEGTEKIVELARARELDLPNFWRERLVSVSPEYRNGMANRFYEVFGLAGIRKLGLYSVLFPSRIFGWMKFCDFHFSGVIRPLLPPIVFSAYRRWRRRVAEVAES